MRVPSFEDYRFAGQTPETQSANKVFGRLFTQLVDTGHILGAFPFGSMQLGLNQPGEEADAFSDYDALVAIADGDVDAETTAFGAIHEAAKAFYGETRMPLGTICLTTTQLANGSHTLHLPFLEWLKAQRESQPQKVIGMDFIGDIHPRLRQASSPIFTSTNGYVRSMRNKLSKAWLSGYYEQPYKSLEDTFNVPHVAARMAINEMSHGGVLEKGVQVDMRKSAITQAVVDVFGAYSKVASLYAEIREDVERYVGLQQTLLTRDEYDTIVFATLESDMPKAIAYLRCLQETCAAMAEARGLQTIVPVDPWQLPLNDDNY